MRLPQLNTQSLPLSVVVGAVVLALLAIMLPSHLLASTDELKFLPADLSYGNVAIGESQALTITVTNNGTKSLTVSSVAASNSKFVVEKLKLPETVAAGGHMNVSVTFTPSAVGKLDGHVTILGDAVNEEFGVSGTGTSTTSKSELKITPSALNFGDVAVGGSGTQAAELTASGGSVTVSSASSSSSLFALPGVDFPFTIASGKSVSVNVTFTPPKSGSASGKVSFASNAGDSPTSSTVSGTGTTPFVSISWSASTSDGITGYNVYRSTTPKGSFVKINSNLVKATSYTDTNVAKGSYAYAATAVNSKGEESGYSTQIDVAVP